jgi:hypothetical protein
LHDPDSCADESADKSCPDRATICHSNKHAYYYSTSDGAADTKAHGATYTETHSAANQPSDVCAN